MRRTRHLLPGRVMWLVFFSLILVMTGAAGVIASVFASHYKPHTTLHWQVAYSLVWLLLVIYGWTFRSGRRLFSLQVWFFWLLLVVALAALHLDDIAPTYMVVNDGLQMRDAANGLYAAVVLDSASAVVLSAHALVLRRIGRRLDRRIRAARAADEDAEGALFESDGNDGESSEGVEGSDDRTPSSH